MVQPITGSQRVLLAGLILLAACGPAEAPAPAAENETARVNADVDASSANEAPTSYTETAEAPVADKSADHDHEHGHDHEHDQHAKSGAGTTHVHGIGNLAVTMENSSVSAQLIAPLANFGLSEAEGVFSDQVIAALPRLISITGGECQAARPVAVIDRSSGHTDADITFNWTCARPEKILSVRFDGFATFAGFEKVSVLVQTGTRQQAAELTPSKPAVALK